MTIRRSGNLDASFCKEHTLAAWVYILSNRSGTLSTGVTTNLERRIWEHKQHRVPGFTQRYQIDRLVWFAETTDIRDAIAREKQIKGWVRAKKIALIAAGNPEWADLSEGWFGADDNRA